MQEARIGNAAYCQEVTGVLRETVRPAEADFFARQSAGRRAELKHWQQAYIDVSRRLLEAEQEIVHLKGKARAVEVIAELARG
jgi:hypothetical protein